MAPGILLYPRRRKRRLLLPPNARRLHRPLPPPPDPRRTPAFPHVSRFTFHGKRLPLSTLNYQLQELSTLPRPRHRPQTQPLRSRRRRKSRLRHLRPPPPRTPRQILHRNRIQSLSLAPPAPAQTRLH